MIDISNSEVPAGRWRGGPWGHHHGHDLPVPSCHRLRATAGILAPNIVDKVAEPAPAADNAPSRTGRSGPAAPALPAGPSRGER